MKAVTLYEWEPSDPSRDFVLKAYRAISGFQRCTAIDEAGRNALLAILDGQFSAEQVLGVASHLNTLASRAEIRAKANLKHHLPRVQEAGKTLANAAKQARSAAAKLQNIFDQALDNLLK